MNKIPSTPKVTSILPLTLAQKSSIAAQVTSEATDEYLLSSVLKLAFLIKPKLESRRLNTAFRKLVQRHDALRQTFSRQNGKWVVNVWNEHPTGIQHEEHGDVGAGEFEQILNDHASRHINIERDPLFQFIVLHFGKRGDVLFIKAEHCNSDGHSMIIIMEDFIKLLLGIPLIGKPLSHQQYLEKFDAAGPARRSQVDNYWRSLLFPVLPRPDTGSFGTGAKTPRRNFDMGRFRSAKRTIANDKFKIAMKKIKDVPITEFQYILAVFSKSLKDLSELPGFYVITAIDRIHSQLKYQVGCITGSIPIRCDFNSNVDTLQLARQFGKQLSDSIQHLPSEVMYPEMKYDHEIYAEGGALRNFCCAMILPDARVKQSPFASAMMARSMVPQNLGSIQITKLDIDTQEGSAFGLLLTILPEADRILLSVKFHEHLYSNDDVLKLLARMQDYLDLEFSIE